MSETDQPAEQPSPGRLLAAARAERNLSIADVSQQIKYGARQIEAIEADDYAKLPGTTFVRGMIRGYAKLVQIDPQPLLAGMNQAHVSAAATVELRASRLEPFPNGSKKSSRVFALLSVAVLAAVAIVAYEWHAAPPSAGEVVTITPRVPKIAVVQGPVDAIASDPQPGATAQAAQTTQTKKTRLAQTQGSQTQAPPATAAADPRKGGKLKRIELEFERESWVEIKQASGKTILSQLNAAGTTQVIKGLPPFEVIIGNAASVRLTYNDLPVDLRPYFKFDVARLTLD